MVPEIWSMMDRTFYHFGPFFYLLPPDNENFEKMKKNSWIYYHNHMMYGSRDMGCSRQDFLTFWTIFCPFTPLTRKRKILKKRKKKMPQDIIILHMCTKNCDHIMYGS